METSSRTGNGHQNVVCYKEWHHFVVMILQQGPAPGSSQTYYQYPFLATI